jgi:hypothetical protein
MGIWDWYTSSMRQFRRDEDRERIRMGRYHSAGFDCQESDPARSLALFTEGRNLAAQLNEPWWVLFYDVWRVQAQTDYLEDYRDVLDLAVRTALEFRKSSYTGHPWKFAIFNHLLRIYTEIDPVGHADAIREALAYLDAEVPAGPGADRYVLLGRKRKFALELGDLDEAERVAKSCLALAAEARTERPGWYTISSYCDLCLINQRRGNWEGVAENAKQAEIMARGEAQRERELGEAFLWQACVAKQGADQKQAERLLRLALSRVGRFRRPPSKEFFEALAFYHEMAGDFEAGLETREREWQATSGKGRLVYECEVQIQRCRFLSRLGKLTEEDLALARTAAGKLRIPDRYLASLARAVEGSGDRRAPGEQLP